MRRNIFLINLMNTDTCIFGAAASADLCIPVLNLISSTQTVDLAVPSRSNKPADTWYAFPFPIKNYEALTWEKWPLWWIGSEPIKRGNFKQILTFNKQKMSPQFWIILSKLFLTLSVYTSVSFQDCLKLLRDAAKSYFLYDSAMKALPPHPPQA